MATGTRSHRGSAALWALTIANALPLFATRWLPFADLPEHVAAIATLQRILVTGTTHAEPYVLDLAHSQYILFHLSGALVTTFTGDAVLATQLLLAGAAIAWPFAFRSLLRALRRDERLALFAPMVFWNRALVMGFLPFVASMPMALLAFSLLVRRRRAWLGVVAFALFYTHVSAWSVFLVVAGAWLVAHHAMRSRDPIAFAQDVAPLVPSILAALIWARAGSLAGSTIPHADALGRMGVMRSVSALPIWTFDIWRSHVDEILSGLWWLALGIAVVLRFGRGRRPSPLLFVPVGCAIVAYMATPFRVGMASMLNVRLAPFVTLLALLPFELPRGRHARLPIAIVAFATLGSAALATYEMRATANEMIGDFDQLLVQMRPGSRVAMLAFHRSSSRMHFWPYMFAGSYHRAQGGGVSSWSFSELPHWPLHYVASEAPPRLPPFAVFEPCTYRYREDGDYYDYVLVQGDVDPFRSAHPGAQYDPIARSGEFMLFQKTSPSRTKEEAGPCASPSIADGREP